MLLVNGGSSASIGCGVLRPFSPICEHNVRRIKNRVARSDSGSDDGGRILRRVIGVSGRDIGSLVADTDCEDRFDVARDLERGCSRDIDLDGRLRAFEDVQAERNYGYTPWTKAREIGRAHV